MYSGWLVAGRAWTIWLRLHTKPERICFQLSRCAAEKEPGFTLAGRETDTQYLTDGAFPSLLSASSLEAWWADICQQSPVQGTPPPQSARCPMFYLLK